MSPGVSRSGVVVIAEIGVNHNGSLSLAKELVVQAAEAGADYAKFQTFSAQDLASEAAPVADYQKNASRAERQVDLLSSLELTDQHFEELVSFCASHQIGFLTTAHDLGSAEFVLRLRSDFIKVPSGDVTNFPFLRLVGQQDKPVLLSTGASAGEEVLRAIQVLEAEGLARSKITVMQCTSEYPAPTGEANLLAMVEMGRQWGVPIGYSDHTLGYETAVAAVALGATVLEKHITLDREMEGPDHTASLEPEDFARMVSAVRSVEQALGTTVKVVTNAEAKNRNVIRKSIVARLPISEGDALTEENLAVMRPGTGLSPMDWLTVVGKVATRAYAPQEFIDGP